MRRAAAESPFAVGLGKRVCAAGARGGVAAPPAEDASAPATHVQTARTELRGGLRAVGLRTRSARGAGAGAAPALVSRSSPPSPAGRL